MKRSSRNGLARAQASAGRPCQRKTGSFQRGRRVAAVNAVLPTLIARPGWRSLRDVVSMLKG